MNKWTKTKLRETDEITFVMSILTERRKKLNPNAPFAQKIAAAYLLLDKIRGGCPVEPGEDIWETLRERIHGEADNDYRLDDIKKHLEDDELETIDLHGLKMEDVIADKQIMHSILVRLNGCSCENDYWENVEYSIEKGIKDILDKRKGSVAG